MNDIDMEKMLVEVVTGKPPTDTSYEASVIREQLQKECNEIIAKGGSIEIPPEIAG